MAIDLRSDTVTKPSATMRRAMFEAEVGDDVYGEDPTINRLEARAAEIMGKEAALFLPSGTMGNQVAVLTHVRRGDEVILESESHIFYYEVGGLAALAGAQARILPGNRGMMDPDQVKASIRGENIHFPRTGLICLENTHNRAGGAVLPQAGVEAICRAAHEQGVPVHMDGARIFNAAVAQNRPVAELAAPLDSIQFCLSKGLGAPVGSMLAGSKSFIENARKFRKLLGGGMRQAGVLAAAGLLALEEGPARIAEDHANARFLAEGLRELPGLQVDLEWVETNMVVAYVEDPRWDGPSLSGALSQAGVLCNAMGPRMIRLVTHLDVSRTQLEEALPIFARVLKAGPSGDSGVCYG